MVAEGVAYYYAFGRLTQFPGPGDTRLRPIESVAEFVDQEYAEWLDKQLR